ncbi:putative trypsin-6 [Choristoneura fumiferana]|uniref:putative trypsin-6 n=1 Tax=Choristoneura fumiferana TaxID=7141 RepID=UPI003D154D64
MAYNFKNVIQMLVISSVAAKEIRPRVVGGVEDTDKEFPFAVVIQEAVLSGYLVCSGSLIAPLWVLTAGHCVPKPDLIIRIKYGDTKIPTNETKFLAKVIKRIKHPSYRLSKHYVANDIGLLKTEKITNPILGKLYAVDYRALMGLPVKYAGFGRSELLAPGQLRPAEGSLDPPLLMGKAMVISCRQDRGLSVAHPGICVAPSCGPRQHVYFGDSGGPLVFNGRIIGVASGFESIKVPIVGFSPVSPYLDWIYDTTGAD